MARLSEVDSKTISVRIPMNRYIDLLNEAMEKKLSISELITLYLFGKASKEKPQEPEKKPAEITVTNLKVIFTGNKHQVLSFLWDRGERKCRTKIENTLRGQSVEIGKYLIENEGRNKLKVFA